MAGLTNYTRNNIIDALLRGEALTQPASVFVALCSTLPSASAAGTEFTGTGYARQEVECTLTDWCGTQAAGSTTVSTGTTGRTANNALIDFGIAGSNWGVAAYWELWDTVTGGNRLLWGEITDGTGTPTPRTVVTNDPVSFPINALSVTFF